MYDYHLKIKLLLFFPWFVYRYVDSWLEKPNTVSLVIPVKRHQTLLSNRLQRREQEHLLSGKCCTMLNRVLAA